MFYHLQNNDTITALKYLHNKLIVQHTNTRMGDIEMGISKGRGEGLKE